MTSSSRVGLIAIIGMFAMAGCSQAITDDAKTSKSQVDALEKVTEKGPVKLRLRITPAQPRLSDLVEMDIQVTAQPDVEILPPSFGQAVGDFLVRDYSERTDSDEPRQTGDATVRRFRYQLEPMHAGRHLIRSMAIEFTDRRAGSESKGETAFIETDPLEVQVTSELGDQLPNLADLDPMLPPRPLQSPLHQSWLAIMIVAGLAMAVAIWFRRRRKTVMIAPVKQTPEEIAHAALAALLAERLPDRGLVKQFYLRLTGIVRQFIEGTTGLRAPEQTTEEFLQAMRSHNVFPLERSVRLKDFLEAADMVKYAGQQPDQDQIELSIARAREFIDLEPAHPLASAVSAGRTES